jgi:lysophospholipase L1-like esterase
VQQISELSRSRNIFFYLLGFLLVAGVLEGVSYVLLGHYQAIASTRELLLGDKLAQTDVNATPQAYLLYIPTPNFTANGVQQNNAQGYRGEAIPVQRSANTLRVLFLGGSTTYGEGVNQPNETYPAQLGLLLQQVPAFSNRQIEILNAGLRWGTSAEILTHYLLKFRYYRPDLVIINPGGNDPVAYTTLNYQPDYSNWRKPPRTVDALHPQARWLLHSRLASAAIVLLFYPDVVEGSTFVHNGEAAPARWFTPQRSGELKLSEQAFYNNVSTVVREILQDGAQVLLLSYQGNPFDIGDQEAWRQYYDHEEVVLQQVAKEQRVLFAPFPLAQMPGKVWADPSHLNAEGERIKAEYVHQALQPMFPVLASGRSVAQANDDVEQVLTLDIPWH